MRPGLTFDTEHFQAFASLLTIPSKEGDEETGSQAYVPPDAKDDKALRSALALIRGEQQNAAYPPNPKLGVPN